MTENKKYFTQNTGYTSEEKRLIRNLRKCSRKEREILMVLVEKTAMHMTDLSNVESLLKKYHGKAE